MLDDFNQYTVATVARMLRADPLLTEQQAAARMKALAADAGLELSTEHIVRLMDGLHQQGVPNPAWLESMGITPHFFMANSRPGYLRQLAAKEPHRATMISQYIIYGEWDTIIAFRGRNEEAEVIRDRLESSAIEAPIRFEVHQIMSEHLMRKPFHPPDPQPNLEEINALIGDCRGAPDNEVLSELVRSGYLLGTAWRIARASPYPVRAFVGMTLRGPGIESDELVRALCRDQVLGDVLTQLYEVNQGRPYHYVAMLECLNMAELDEATTVIGSIRLGGSRLEGTTFVIANAVESSWEVEPASHPPVLALGIDLSPLVQAAEQAILDLPAETQASFSSLDQLQQLSVIKSIVELRSRLHSAHLSASAKSRFDSALATFLRECATRERQPNFTGAIAEAVTTVEGLCRRLLSKLAYACLGNNPGTIQELLKLPDATFAKLAMGKIIGAFHQAKKLPQFSVYQADLDPGFVERLESFTNQRNVWLHDAATADYGDIVEEVRRVIIVGIDLAEFAESLTAKIQQTKGANPSDLVVDIKQQSELPSAFISHSTSDSAIAERVAAGLKVFGIQSWYSGWELAPGDSLIQRINEGLAGSDTVIVLLSERSVQSKWVNQEVSSALAAQLAGANVRIIPVVVERCVIPPLLTDMARIDLSRDFEDGLLKLISFLRKERAV